MPSLLQVFGNTRENSVDCAIRISALLYAALFNIALNLMLKNILDGNVVCAAVSCEIAFPCSSFCSCFYYAANAIIFLLHMVRVC